MGEKKVFSMTGYGKGASQSDGLQVTIELRSVNHRFLNISVKAPRNCLFAESIIRATLKEHISRGHIEVFFRVDDKREQQERISVDDFLANKYIEISKNLEKLGLNNDFGVSKLMSLPNIIQIEHIDEDVSETTILLNEALKEAVDALNLMRFSEGISLVKDAKSKINSLRVLFVEISSLHKSLESERLKNLREKLIDLLNEDTLSIRISNEISLYIDKISIDEEVTRLDSHIHQYEKLIAEGGAIGKKLDFLSQEVYRELNTIASKTPEIEITNLVLEAKNIVETIREQAQNLE